ncbi:GAF domain-containing protein [Halolamina salifodinae]|uniref:PAS domain S-box-containing protein n=1 Tax=Halolamina salifodinae TaxID=1202767 RepID=A0A8T4GZH1_9EURY|nr:GAF domain-containing protein [Halolamina salifodinae]MBP1986508.1 PAS domain S-box-containing protein [Halolamina salifodinae]
MEDGGTQGDAETVARVRITDATFSLDTDWQFTYVDDRARELFGLEDRDVVGRSIWLIVPELAGSAFQDRCAEAMGRGRSLRVEQPVPSLEKRFSMRLYPSETGVTVCAREVPPDEQRGERLQRTVAETITDAVVTIDGDSTIRRANRAIEAVFGYTPAELIGEPLSTLMPEGYAERHRDAVERYLETGERTMDWRGTELPGVRKDGERIDLSISFAAHEDDGQRFTGVIRDVTDRNRRERALREANDVIADTEADLDEKTDRLLEICRDAVDTSFATLSQAAGSDYLFDSVLAPADAGLESGDVVPLSSTNCEHVIETGETLVLDDIAEQAPALADRAGNVDLGVGCYLGAPIHVDGETVGTFCFYGDGPRDQPFTDWQVAFVEHLAAWIGNELERQRYVGRLTALDELNQVVQAVTDEAISQPTRAAIERRTCEAIAETDSYLFAWIGEANPGDQSVEPRAEAGVEGYADAVSISVDPEEQESEGPTGRAFRTGEVQTVHDVVSDPDYRPWQDSAHDYGFRSSAAVPIEHEGTIYGVLNVYTGRVNAFTGAERDVIGLLGKIVGHAIAAIDRKQVLLADSVIDLEFRVTDVFESFDADLGAGDAVHIDAAVPRENDEFVVFGTTDEGGIDLVKQLIAADSNWEELLATRETDAGRSFEVLIVGPHLLSAVSAVGGRFVEAVIRDGDLRSRIQLPTDADAREVLDSVRERYPQTTLVSKQEVQATESDARSGPAVDVEELTERRLETLRTAYHAGYFEWPREAAGEEVAELLDIAPPTFSQHLRAAEQAVFEMLFEESERP